MAADKKRILAIAKFDALRKNLPECIDETVVQEYHGILELLSETYQEDLSSFRVDHTDMKRRSVIDLGSRRRPATAQPIGLPYCDRDLLERRMQGVDTYLASIQPSPVEEEDAPFGFPR